MFTPVQAAEVKALACQLPAEHGVPLSMWSAPELAREAITAGIVDAVSASSVRRWLAADAIKSKAQGMGYEVRRLGQEDGCYEVKGMKDGKRVEAYFDPITGEVVKVKGES